MKRWGMAGVALAAAALLVVVATIGVGLRSIDGQDGNGRTAAAAAGGPWNGRSPAPGPANPASLVLPVVRGDQPSPVMLTRSMLEQAWLDTRLDVRLPDGTAYPVVLEHERVEPGGHWTVVGRVSTRLGPQAMVVTVGQDAIFGVLPHPDGSMMQITTSSGSTSIAAAGGMLPPGSEITRPTEPDYLIPHESDRWTAAKAGGMRFPEAGSNWTTKSLSLVEIDVLALYTDDLVALRGSVSAAETEVTNLFAIANQAHVDSGTRVRFKLEGMRRVAVDPTLTNHNALYAISNNSVQGIDLHSLRDEMAADLVALLRPYRDTHGTCGVAWLNGAELNPYGIWDSSGVSVSNVAPCGPHVLAHELGHNMGSVHDRETQSINGQIEYGAYPYSFGYRQNGPMAFATIMAYTSGQPWLGYFSNPGSTRCGDACGVEGRADNVRSLNATAPVIAMFRGPPGTLSIGDSEIYEPQPGDAGYLEFSVRLSGAAPAGGVSFEVSVVGGTAQPSVDYVQPGTIRGTIAEGQRVTYVSLQVNGDAIEEHDETILLRLTNVTGATVHKGEAVGRILNDDPRVVFSGRMRFEGAPAPAVPFSMIVTGIDGAGTSRQITLSPPDFAYHMPVVKGASLRFQIAAPLPFVTQPFFMESIGSSTMRDIRLKRGVQVSGQLRLPAGQPVITTPISVEMRARVDNQLDFFYLQLQPPDFRYSQWVAPGAWIRLEATPPSPYTPFFAIHSIVESDLVQDITVSPLPGLVLRGGGKMPEGTSATWGSAGGLVELSAPAPAGGVQLRYRTVDGTATAGSDYAAIEGALEIAEGATYAHLDSITVFGDDQLEGDEYFYIVVSDVVGAHPVVTRQKLILTEQPRYMSEPLPARPVR